MDQLFNILWTLLIYGAIFGILWWMLTAVSAKAVSLQPFLNIAWIALIIAMGCVAIAILIGRIPLMPFLTFGTSLR